MSAPLTLHYFNLGRLGRGEVVRVYLKDAGIPYEEVYYDYGQWKKSKAEEAGLNLTGSLPVLEIDGHKISQSLPILRYLSRKEGKYDGESSYEKYLVDAVSDFYADWRTQWVYALSNMTDEYKNETVPRAHKVLDEYYKMNEGPYLLGDKPTYADFAVHMLLHNDAAAGSKPDKIPESLQKLMDAVNNRPNLKEYLKE